MKTRQPHKLLRHNTIEMNESIYVSILNFTYKKYKLTVHSGRLDFTLEFPDQSYITDSFNGLSKRKRLYQQIDNGVYEWLKEKEQAIKLTEAMDGIIHFKIPFEYAEYHIAIDTNRERGWILFPEYINGFDFDEIYLQIAELPLIADGELNHILRDKLEDLGINLPATPYEVGLSVTNK